MELSFEFAELPVTAQKRPEIIEVYRSLIAKQLSPETEEVSL